MVVQMHLAAASVALRPDGRRSQGCPPSGFLAALAARTGLTAVTTALLSLEAALATYLHLAALALASLSLEPSSEVPSLMVPPPAVRQATLAARPCLAAGADASSSSDNAYAREALTLALSLLEPSSKAPLLMLPPLAMRPAARAALMRLAAKAAASSVSEAALGAYTCLAAPPRPRCCQSPRCGPRCRSRGPRSCVQPLLPCTCASRWRL